MQYNATPLRPQPRSHYAGNGSKVHDVNYVWDAASSIIGLTMPVYTFNGQILAILSRDPTQGRFVAAPRE